MIRTSTVGSVLELRFVNGKQFVVRQADEVHPLQCEAHVEYACCHPVGEMKVCHSPITVRRHAGSPRTYQKLSAVIFNQNECDPHRGGILIDPRSNYLVWLTWLQR